MYPYDLKQKEKEARLLQKLVALTELHQKRCPEYTRLLELFYKDRTRYERVADIPYLPVNIFKTQKLVSVEQDKVFKVLSSSGTTSTHPSKIYLDVETSKADQQGLVDIMTSFLGPKRLPMLVLDRKPNLEDRHAFNASIAALLGMMNFGYDVLYALDDDRQQVASWLEKYKDVPKLVFGRTFVIFCAMQEYELNISHGILVHGGGWKKLHEQAITNQQFKQMVAKRLHIERCHNFYGMVEQVGSIYVECEYGHLHAPLFSDVIMRDTRTLKECPEGIIQVVSEFPSSYPGHSLLTEDLGRLFGIDDCPCKRYGKYFEVIGRIPQAEIRGCSDAYAYGSTI